MSASRDSTNARWPMRFASFVFFMFIAAAGFSAFSLNKSAHTCELQYDTASMAITTGTENAGDREKLRTKLDNAWRAFWKDKKLDVANGSLDALMHLLDGNPTQRISAENKALIAETVDEFRRCINGLPPSGTANISVSVFEPNEEAVDGKGPPAGAGIYLFVDGKHLGFTDADGKAVLTVPAGSVALQAIRPSAAIAESTVQIGAGETIALELILDDGKEVTSPVQLLVTGLDGHVLPSALQSFTIMLTENGSIKPVADLVEVAIEDDIGNTLARITDNFTVDSSGVLQPVSLQAVENAIRPHSGRSLVLRVVAEDALGFTLVGTIPLYYGQNTLDVTLVAPPSNPDLKVAGLQVSYRLMGTDLVLTRITDAAGTASFGKVPLGNAEVEAQTTEGELYYYGRADFFLDRARMARITMTHSDDLVDGLDDFELLTLASASSESSAFALDQTEDPERRSLHDASQSDDIIPLATATLRVGANAANQAVTRNTTLVVPRGTSRVLLRYQVTTLEYPTYVQQQSIYNDTWSLYVRARTSGRQLFGISRNVNAQLRQAPIWLPSGSTGYIESSLDVSALTTQSDATLLIVASATNVADALLPTIVEAELSDDPNRLVIEDVVSDRLQNTTGDSRTYSIPLQGQTNSLSRRFTLTISKPQDAQVTRVRVELQSGSRTLGRVFEEAPGTNVEILNATTLRVRATFHGGNAGTIGTVPPPTHTITYKFTVFADRQGTEISDDAISPAKRSLWRMQAAWRDPSRRYGQRDSGGDDWLSERTWDYINRHGNLLTRIDDISGEHGRNIGHNTHDVGTDIDLFHVYQFPGAYSGGNNYNLLRDAVVRVLTLPTAQTAADRGAVNAWVSQSRTRFRDILTTTDAETLYYAIGSAHTQGGVSLPRGWARRLLVSGTVASQQGASYDTGLGAWTYNPGNRMVFNATHNSHFHIKRPRER